jgi:hypothetical protein
MAFRNSSKVILLSPFISKAFIKLITSSSPYERPNLEFILSTIRAASFMLIVPDRSLSIALNNASKVAVREAIELFDGFLLNFSFVLF